MAKEGAFDRRTRYFAFLSNPGPCTIIKHKNLYVKALKRHQTAIQDEIRETLQGDDR